MRFVTGVVATVARLDGDGDPHAVLAALGIPPGRPVLVLCGGAATLDADMAVRAALAPVLGPAVLAATRRVAGLIVDGGTDAGVPALIGQAASGVDRPTPLLGVAPAALVTADGAAERDGQVALEPHHPFFVLTPGQAWGDETEWLASMAAAAAGEEPVVMVVAGGGAVALAEVREAVRRGWPVVLLLATGGLADELAARWRSAHLPAPRQRWRDRLIHRQTAPASGELLADRAGFPPDELERLAGRGFFRLVPPEDANDLAAALDWELHPRSVLGRAWQRFARYDQAAVRLRRSFETSQVTILGLGLAATLLALVLRGLESPLNASASWIGTALHYSVVALPLLAAALIAFADRFAFGKRWVLLRGAAETVKGEIYWYRTGTGIYADSDHPGTPSPERRLAARLEAVDRRLFDTEVSASELPAYTGGLPPRESWIAATDDGFSRLNADRYLAVRVADQIRFYRSRTRANGRRLRLIQAVVLLAAASGSLVAAVGQEIWVGFTTALATAFAVYRGYLQLDATVVAYNQAASRLENLDSYWAALTRADRIAEYPWLVEQTEAVLQTELGGWVQQMNEALQALRRQQAAEHQQAMQAMQRDVAANREHGGEPVAELGANEQGSSQRVPGHHSGTDQHLPDAGSQDRCPSTASVAPAQRPTPGDRP